MSSRSCSATLALAASLLLSTAMRAEDYALGVILSLTGPGSVDTSKDLEEVTLAVDEINAAGGLLGQHKIVLTMKDDQGKPDISATQAKVLLAEAKPHALIGVWSSGIATAAGPMSSYRWKGRRATVRPDPGQQRSARQHPRPCSPSSSSPPSSLTTPSSNADARSRCGAAARLVTG